MQTPCSHDGCQQVSWALKHALHGLKKRGGLGGGAAPPICKHNEHTRCSQLVSWALKHAWYSLKEAGGLGRLCPHLQTPCSHDGFQLLSCALAEKKRGGVGGGRSPPPHLQCSQRCFCSTSFLGFEARLAAPPHVQTPCSHDGCQQVSWALKRALHGLKKKKKKKKKKRGGGGGAQPPHLQTQCSHDAFQLVSWALKHAWYG